MSGNESAPIGSDISEPVAHQPSGHIKDDPPLRTGRGNKDNSGGDGRLDEAVDEFKGYFELMQNITPLCRAWRTHPCADPAKSAKWGSVELFGDQDKQDIGQLRGLNVGYLAGLSQRLHSVGVSMSKLDNHSTNMKKTLDENWNSKSSDKALDKFADLGGASRGCKEQVDTLSQHVRGMHKAAYNAKKQLLKLLDDVCAKGSGIIDQKGMIGNNGDDPKEKRDELSNGIKGIDTGLQNGLKFSPGDGLYGRESAYSPSINPSADRQEAAKSNKEDPDDHSTDFKEPGSFGPADMRKPGFCRLDGTGNDDLDIDKYSDQIVRELDGLCSHYFGSLEYYRNTVKGIHNSLDKAMSTLRSGVGSVHKDPFGKLVAPGDAPPPGQRHKPDDSGHRRNHQPPPSPRHDTGGNTSTADTGDTGGTSKAPAATPGTGADSGGAVGPAAVAPGGQPGAQGDGQPSIPLPARDQGDRPDGMPGQGQDGQPVPPGQEQTPGAQPGAEHPQTVKVQGPDGKDIEMTSPDGQGHMKLTVDDGSGHPKSYEVDFSQGTAQQPGTAQADGGAPPAAGEGDAPIPGQSGMLDRSQHVPADQSGHAVIHDGDNTITVDKSPESGDVKVTVDDGSGHPTSYTLDSGAGGGDGAPGVAPSGELAGDGGTVSGAAAPAPDVPAQDVPAQGAEAALGGGGQTDAVDTGARGSAHGFAGETNTANTTGGDPAGGDSTGAGGFGAATGGAGGAEGIGGGDSGGQPLQQGAVTGADPSMTGGSHGGVGAGVGDAQAPHAGGAGGPGVGAPVGGGGGGGEHGGGMGMMPPMMGGMGGMGGGNAERGASAWRTEGNLFDDLGESIAEQAEDFLTGRDS